MMWWALFHPWKYRRAMREFERVFAEYDLIERWAQP